MALHKVIVPISTYVEHPAEASFGFDALIPPVFYGDSRLFNSLPSPDDVYLLIQAFGAMGSGPFVLRVLLNGTELGLLEFDRWVTHTSMVATAKFVYVAPGTLQLGPPPIGSPPGSTNNTIAFEPLFPGDPYFFVGPVICHY